MMVTTNNVWMSHGDIKVSVIPEGFSLLLKHTKLSIAAVSDETRRFYGVSNSTLSDPYGERRKVIIIELCAWDLWMP